MRSDAAFDEIDPAGEQKIAPQSVEILGLPSNRYGLFEELYHSGSASRSLDSRRVPDCSRFATRTKSRAIVHEENSA